MSYETVIWEVDEGVGRLTLNRPDSLNAWTTDFGEELKRIMSVDAADPSVRAVLITGAGRGFSSGAGTITGCLDGPSGVDFDLYLQKLSGSTWSNVAQGITSAPDENVSYNGTSGTYRWRVTSYSGSGSYTGGYSTP